MHLVDLSSELLKLAEIEIQKAELTENVLGVSKLDARDLGLLADESFDATLLMGPLYHLIEEEDRTKSLVEVLRVTKSGGLIFSATINRVCPFLNMMHMHTRQLAIELSEDTEEMQRILAHGKYENFEENPNNFTDAYFSNVHEVPQLYKKLGVELVESFACEGLASYLYDKAEIIKKNKIAWERFLDVIYDNANKPELLGVSEHVVFVGRKL